MRSSDDQSTTDRRRPHAYCTVFTHVSGDADGGGRDPQTFYDAVGGAETFRTIVARFYELVREDEVLRPLYPDG